MEPSNIINGKRVAITHGELVLIPVDRIEGAKTRNAKMEILAHSETGHHHVLECETAFKVSEPVYTDHARERALVVKQVAKLWHNKSTDIHETRYVAPGAYIVREKTEYNPFTKVMQRVFD